MKLALTTFLLFSISAFQLFSQATSTIESLTDATTISASDKVWMVDVDGTTADVDATLEQIVSPFAADPSSNSAFSAAAWLTDLGAATAAQGATADSAVQLDFISPAPATSTSTGVQGQMIYAGNYLYICIATDTWRRAQLLNW